MSNVHDFDTGVAHTFLQIERAKQEWEATAVSLASVVCLVDKRSQILRANRAIESWHLGHVKNIKGLELHTLFHPDCHSASCYLSRFLSQAWGILRQDEFAECEAYDQVLRRNLSVQLRTITLPKDRLFLGGSDVAVSIVSDITDQKQIEQTRRIREQEYHQCFEQIPMPLAIVRLSRLLFVNQAFAVMFGYASEDLYKMNPLNLFLENDRELVKSHLSTIPSSKNTWRWEVAGTTGKGREILLDVKQSLVTWQGQSAFLLTIRDNTLQALWESRIKKEIAQLKHHQLPFNPFGMRFQEAVEAFEKYLLTTVLARHEGQQRKILDILGLPPKVFCQKIRKYGLKKS